MKKHLSKSLSPCDTPKSLSKIPFLTEKLLGKYLKLLYPNNIFINDKSIKESYIRHRPDYYCKELKLVVEYDGPTHYTSAKTILNDHYKDDVYSKMGIKIIRIPYFIQLDTDTVEYFFGIKDWISPEEIIYPHGFIDKKTILPANYCSLGVAKWKNWAKIFKESNESFPT